MSSVFHWSNGRALAAHQFLHILATFPCVFQFFVSVFPITIKPMWSMYLGQMASACFLFRTSHRGVKYMRNGIADTADPWGIPLRIGLISSLRPSNSGYAVLLLRKDFTLYLEISFVQSAQKVF